MILYVFDIWATSSPENPGTEVALGTNGDEVGKAEDEAELEETISEGRDEEGDEEEVDEGVGVDVGMADSVVGKYVTVTNVPEAAGALRTVAGSRGRMVEGRWRQ